VIKAKLFAMNGSKLVNEVENLIIFCISTVILSFFFYYVLDFSSNKTAGFTVNLVLILKRVILFILGGSIATTVQYLRIKKWNFMLFFWVNIAVAQIYMIIDISFKLSN
jgi:hypothetical protein